MARGAKGQVNAPPVADYRRKVGRQHEKAGKKETAELQSKAAPLAAELQSKAAELPSQAAPLAAELQSKAAELGGSVQSSIAQAAETLRGQASRLSNELK